MLRKLCFIPLPRAQSVFTYVTKPVLFAHNRSYTTTTDLVSNVTNKAKYVIASSTTPDLNSAYDKFQTEFEHLIQNGNQEEYLEKFSEFCNKQDTVYQGYLCRGYALLKLGRHEAARHDLLTLQLLDNQPMIRAGGTGITNERILLLAYHLLFNLYMATDKQKGKEIDACIAGIRNLNPDFAKGQLDVAFYYRVLGDNTIAKKHYDR
jgi:hypothetical protein